MVASVNFVLGEENLLLSSTHSLEERNEWHESFIVSWFAELLHQGLGLLLGQLLSEVGQQTEKLVGKHGVVVVFVVELEDLNEVVESSSSTTKTTTTPCLPTGSLVAVLITLEKYFSFEKSHPENVNSAVIMGTYQIPSTIVGREPSLGSHSRRIVRDGCFRG